jgi:dTDP-glucose 4,6-dehydratase
MRGDMPEKTFVVLGSNCFTGSHIVDALLANPTNRIIGVSRSPEYKAWYLPYKRWPSPNFEFHQIHLLKEFDALIALLEKLKPQVVINTIALTEVALSNYRPIEYFETNTLGIIKLAKYLLDCSYLERYIHISAAEIMGSCRTPVTEEAPFRPSTPYAVSKAAADMYLNTLIANFGFPATLIRSTNVYGKHQQLFKIIPRTVIYLKAGKTIELHGGGKAIKSFIHIRDVVRGMMLALERGASGTYHFTVPSDQTVADVVRYVCRKMGHDFDKSTRVVADRLAQDSRNWLDCSKAERELGWKAEIPFEEGVQEVINWVESHWDEVIRDPLEYLHKL